MDELKRRISSMKDNQYTTLTIEKEEQDETRQNLNKDRKLTVEIPKHKSVVYKDMDFTDTFKNLRTLELYSNFYSTELNKNLNQIDEKFLSFRERFERIKKNFNNSEYKRSDQNKDLMERPQPEFLELENIGENLKNLYNYHFLYEKFNDQQKLSDIINQINTDQFEKNKQNKMIQIELYPQQYQEYKELDDKVQKKFEEVLSRYLQLEQKVGTSKKSIKFIQQEPLYKMALRFQNEIENHIMKSANDTNVKTSITNIKEHIVEINSKLENYLKQLSSDKYFKDSDDTQQIFKILDFYKEHQNNEKILKETLKYKSSIEKIIQEQKDIQDQNLDDMMDALEKTLDDNDKTIVDIKSKLKGDFLKLVEKL